MEPVFGLVVTMVVHAVLGALLTVGANGSGVLLRSPMLVTITAYGAAIGCIPLVTKQPCKPRSSKSVLPVTAS